MSKSSTQKMFIDQFGQPRAVGEVWIDRSGHECSFRDNGSLKMTLVNKEPSLTIQSEKDACDLNKIMERFNRTGVMTNIRTKPLQFGGFQSQDDYHQTMIRIQEAEDAFMELPAQTRARFDNDLGKLVDFMGNPENRAEAIKLGLMTAHEVQPVQEPVTPPVGEGSEPASTST